jgi:hypothetical protein
MTGDVLAEDPLCTHSPGTLRPLAAAVEYGTQAPRELVWEPAAEERLRQVPAFVRGMVSRRVETYCREQGLPRVTADVLAEIRARMPTAKLFRRG